MVPLRDAVIYLKGRSSRSRGFALITVLAILALLLVLILVISTLIHVETRTRASGKNLLLARQNALLGLDTAIAQLQEYAGKDQAVTFPATTFYPTKNVNLPTATAPRQGKGEIFDNTTYGLRSFAKVARTRSYLTNPTTYLVPAEREQWNTAVNTWWNQGRSPHWTGIMDASLRVDAATSPSSKPTALAAQTYESNTNTIYGEPKRDQLPVWLVSGNEQFTVDQENNRVLNASGAVVATDAYPSGYQTPDTIMPDPGSDSTVVELVGSGSATDQTKSADGMDGRVRVRKQEISATDTTGTERVTGHYAYWVGDESTKANFALHDATSQNDTSYPNDVSKTSTTYRNRLQSPQRIGWQNIDGFASATFLPNDPNLENISTSLEIALLEDSKTADIFEAGKENFHNLTAFSRSLLTDTSLGGLKSDLTRFLKSGTGLSSSDTIPDRSRYDSQDPRFRAWGGVNTGFPSSGATTAVDGIPTWNQMRQWYQSTSSGGGAVVPSKASGIFPIVTQVAFQGAWSYRNQRIRLHWMPMIVLWNPYDTPLSSTTYSLDVSFSPTTWFVYLCKPNPSLAELQAADPDANWTGDPGNKSSWKFTDTNGNQQSIVIPVSPDTIDAHDTKSGPWPKGDIANGSTDMFGRLFYDMKAADSQVYAGYQGAGMTTSTRDDSKGPLGPKNRCLRFSAHENYLQPANEAKTTTPRVFHFKITAAFGAGEARVFTVGTTQEWKPEADIPLVNDINLTEMPPQVWFDALEVVNGPASAEASGLRFLPGPGLSGAAIGAPSVTLSLNGDTLFYMKSFGVIAADQAWQQSAGKDWNTWNDTNTTIPYPAYVSYWRKLNDFDSSAFNANFDPAATWETNATNWAYGVSWLQPFSGLDEGSTNGTNLQNYLGAFSKFNLGATYMDLHPEVDVYRAVDYVNNSDRFTKMYHLRSNKRQAWDDNQASGEFGYALLTRQSNASNPFAGLSTLAIRNARRAQSEILSLGQFQQINLSPYIWEPAFPIGNSFAPPYTDREAIAGIKSRTVGLANGMGVQLSSLPNAADKGTVTKNFSPNTMKTLTPGNLTMDLSYLLNENLWDRYFLSTIDGTPDLETPLANSRLRFTPEASQATTSELTGFDTSSAYLQNVGAFNVNSTSVEAWKALLTAFRGLSLGDNPANTVPIARTLDPITGAVKFHFDTATLGTRSRFGNTSNTKDYSHVFSGFRYLDDKMIEALAKRIVDEIRQRGPFLSLSDFVNRRLVAPEGAGNTSSSWTSARTDGRPLAGGEFHPRFMSPSYDPFIGLQGLSGTLERAIQLSGINGGVNHPDLGDNGLGTGDNTDMVYTVRIRNTGAEAYSSSNTGWTSAGIGKSANTAKGHNVSAYGGYRHTQEPSMRNYLDSEHLAGAPAGEAGQLLDGSPAFVTQGDLLSMIGPALTPRGDTFLIRTYGDVVDKNQRVISRACLEAVVQREAEPVTPAGTSGASKWRPTDHFGRKFKVVKLRWLNPDDV